jgi:hypothetical protein
MAGQVPQPSQLHVATPLYRGMTRQQYTDRMQASETRRHWAVPGRTTRRTNPLHPEHSEFYEMANLPTVITPGVIALRVARLTAYIMVVDTVGSQLHTLAPALDRTASNGSIIKRVINNNIRVMLDMLFRMEDDESLITEDAWATLQVAADHILAAVSLGGGALHGSYRAQYADRIMSPARNIQFAVQQHEMAGVREVNMTPYEYNQQI